MSRFTKAIVRTPGRSMVSGLTAAGLGRPDYAKALLQHQQYIAALQKCGLEVLLLEPDEDFPDSTFIEDTAILTPECAIITRPAAPSRAGETRATRPVLERFFSRIESIKGPGTLDGGDVMQVGHHFYIGLSKRTNKEGAEQLIQILQSCALSGSMVPVKDFLHLKTGVTCVAEKTLLAAREYLGCPDFTGCRILPVGDDEAGGANCIAINGRILVPAGYPGICQQLARLEKDIIEVDISEFAKLDGGLTCLSLRF